MTLNKFVAASGVALALFSSTASAGIVDPDCTAEKAAKSAAMKSTVGGGGRCKPGEAAKDTLGIDDKGPIENVRDDDGPIENMRDDDHDRKRDRNRDD